MAKPPSPKDEPGYIYVFEIRDDIPHKTNFKVGRAVKLERRLRQWSKHWTSKEEVVLLRGWWPDDGTNSTSMLRGKSKAGEKFPFCHRLERLVLLELADLATHAPYLELGFPNVDANAVASGDTSEPSTPGRSHKPSKVHVPWKPCIDCGTIHRELHSFQRARKGKHRNAEYERLVQPVIAKWGRLVREFL
ncbi:hypothetical protein JB92DRAFT_2912625 [Gautieria morchelliformis]|nr:hypothetical protein JB92DRAFT_2912625 [Gautieria morchelliformis]